MTMELNSLPDFPSELLLPTGAKIGLGDGTTTIAIELAPFSIDEEHVDQSIDFDLGLEAFSLPDLVGQTFTFPSNPEEGYVEGSIYIWSVHNPIDLHSITFGAASEDAIKAKADMTFVFEFEGCAKNLTKSMDLKLTLKEEN
jgi:hypothetical protein